MTTAKKVAEMSPEEKAAHFELEAKEATEKNAALEKKIETLKAAGAVTWGKRAGWAAIGAATGAVITGTTTYFIMRPKVVEVHNP